MLDTSKSSSSNNAGSCAGKANAVRSPPLTTASKPASATAAAASPGPLLRADASNALHATNAAAAAPTIAHAKRNLFAWHATKTPSLPGTTLMTTPPACSSPPLSPRYATTWAATRQTPGGLAPPRTASARIAPLRKRPCALAQRIAHSPAPARFSHCRLVATPVR